MVFKVMESLSKNLPIETNQHGTMYAVVVKELNFSVQEPNQNLCLKIKHNLSKIELLE
jgi:hypothetical protein